MSQLKRFIIHALLILIAACGFLVNGIYYLYRFNGDGIAMWLSIVIAVVLVGFECVLFLTMENWKQKAGWLCIVAFSVVATTGGQMLSLMEKDSEINDVLSSDSNNVFMIKQYKSDKAKAEADWELAHNELLKITSETKSYWYWRNYYTDQKEAAQGRIDEATRQIKALTEATQSSIDGSVKQKTTNIYQLIGRGNETVEFWAQIILQTILSVILALAGPYSLKCLKISKTEPTEQKPSKQKKPSNKEDRAKQQKEDEKRRMGYFCRVAFSNKKDEAIKLISQRVAFTAKDYERYANILKSARHAEVSDARMVLSSPEIVDENDCYKYLVKTLED